MLKVGPELVVLLGGCGTQDRGLVKVRSLESVLLGVILCS